MPLSTRLKRKSAINVALPFGRVGPGADGSNLDTVEQRQVASMGYSLLATQVGAGLVTRRKRASAINVCLPFFRCGFALNGSNLDSPDERKHAAYSYEIGASSIIVPTVYEISGTTSAQPAASGGSLIYVPHVGRGLPYIPVKSRSIGWDTLVRTTDGGNAIKQYPVYQFGNGDRRRNFFQPV